MIKLPCLEFFFGATGCLLNNVISQYGISLRLPRPSLHASPPPSGPSSPTVTARAYLPLVGLRVLRVVCLYLVSVALLAVASQAKVWFAVASKAKFFLSNFPYTLIVGALYANPSLSLPLSLAPSSSVSVSISVSTSVSFLRGPSRPSSCRLFKTPIIHFWGGL